MLVKRLVDCGEQVARDQTLLREVLHPKNDRISLRCSLAHAMLGRGSASRPHRLKTVEVYYVLRGRGIMHIGHESSEVAEGCAVYIPPNAVQYIQNIGDELLEFLCIVDPAWQTEDEEVLG